MNYPKLPEPIVIEGRRLYTSGQMREYAAECLRRSFDESEPTESVIHEKNSLYSAVNCLDALEQLLGGKILSR